VDPIEYLRSLRRRWPMIVAAVLVAVGVAWVTLSSIQPGVRTGPSYNATTVLLSAQSASTDPRVNSLATVAALTTVGEVPENVAEALAYEGDPASLASTVHAVVSRESGLLRISAIATSPDRAELVADTFAEQLITYLERRNAQVATEEAREYRRRISQIEAEIEALDEEIASAPLTEAEQLKGQRETKALEAQGLTTQFQQTAAGPAGSGLEVIQPAIAVAVSPQVDGGGFQPPRSAASRLIIGAVLGLLGGAALALFLDRFDRRIRTREAAEKSFEAVVLAEIPPLPRRGRTGIVASAEPKSPAAEAFRMLGTSVAKGLLPAVEGGSPSSVSTPKVVLVTSPGPSEGKSTVVANLAASMAEIGNRVLVISCDFRDPAVHRLFGVSNSRGLADALRNQAGGAVLNGHMQNTSLRGVRVVASDPGPERPAELLTSDRMRSILAEARREADVVLLDTPAMLVSSDAANLLQEADAVLLVARAGKTTTEVARQTVQLLRRLNAPKMAVALNGATETSTPRGSRLGGWRRT